MTKLIKGTDLRPGDVIVIQNVRVLILLTGLHAPPDLFDRVFDAVWARREDTHAEGYVSYGPEGIFTAAGDVEES